MNKDYNPDLCEEKHDNIDQRISRVEIRMNGFDKKLWALIILMITNLGILIGVLIK